jgi:hypothetical protein
VPFLGTLLLRFECLYVIPIKGSHKTIPITATSSSLVLAALCSHDRCIFSADGRSLSVRKIAPGVPLLVASEAHYASRRRQWVNIKSHRLAASPASVSASNQSITPVAFHPSGGRTSGSIAGTPCRGGIISSTGSAACAGGGGGSVSMVGASMKRR